MGKLFLRKTFYSSVSSSLQSTFTEFHPPWLLAPILKIDLGEEEENPTKQENKISQITFLLCNIYNCLSKTRQNFHSHKAPSEEQQFVTFPLHQESPDFNQPELAAL